MSLAGDSAAAAQAYDKAVSVMDKTIIPITVDLTRLVKNDFDSTNTKHDQAVSRTVGWLVALGLLLLVAIVGVQFLLFKRTNRVMNPALMAAAALTVLFMILTIRPAYGSRSQLTAADRSFGAVYQMRQIRSTGYVASSQESRALLLPQQAATYEAGFRNSVKAMSKELNEWSAKYRSEYPTEQSTAALDK